MRTPHRTRRRFRAAPALVAVALVLCGCASGTVGVSESESAGPGGGGIVTVEPDGAQSRGVDDVDQQTACELVSQSPTLAALGVTGTPTSTQFVRALSLCELRIDSPEHAGSSIGVSVITADDVALMASLDSAAVEGTLALLPGLAENGHFVSGAPGVDPATDPRIGSIAAAQGELGVTISWATAEGLIPFATYEQAVRDLLDALSG